MRELIQDPGYFCLIGIVIHEDYDVLSGNDHRFKSRPIGDSHWDFGGMVDEFIEARGLQGGNIVTHLPKITIPDEKGYDVERMPADPICDVRKIRFCTAGIEQVAGCMTVVDLIMGEMCLALQHTNPVIQLSKDTVVLICGCVVRIHKGGIMSSNKSNVTVFL